MDRIALFLIMSAPSFAKFRAVAFNRLSPKQKESLHRRLLILKVLVRNCSPMTMYAIWKGLRNIDTKGIEKETRIEHTELAFAQVRREIKNLQDEACVVLSRGKRRSTPVEITPRGLRWAVQYGYVTEAQLGAFLEHGSKVLGITLKILSQKDDEGAIFRIILGHVGTMSLTGKFPGFFEIDSGERFPSVHIDELGIIHLSTMIAEGKMTIEEAIALLSKLDADERTTWKNAASVLVTRAKESLKAYDIIDSLTKGI